MLSCLGDYLARKFNEVPGDAALESFLHLMVQAVQHQSLMVSIPVLVSWTKLLNNKELQPGERFASMVGPLLEVCISRLVRYEHLPEESNDPSLLFLLEDTDTMPERHAFLGNYRRYTSQIIEAIVQLKLFDAVSHILSNTEFVLQHLYDGEQALDSKHAKSWSFLRQILMIVESNYSKHSMPALRVDAHFTVIEATLRGYTKWKNTHQSDNVSALIHLNHLLHSRI